MADGFVLPGNDPLLTEATLLALACGARIAGASEEPDEIQSSLANALRQIVLALLDISIMDDADEQRHGLTVLIPLCGVVADAVKAMEELNDAHISTFENDAKQPCESAELQVSENSSDPLNMRRLEIKALRELLSELLFERENLVNIELKDIESTYMRELGVLEAELYRVRSEVNLFKRRLELMQAFINRQEPIRETEINETIRREQVEYELKYEAFAERIREAYFYAKRRQAQEKSVLREDDAQEDPEEERKRLYRKIVKAMHPDLHPNQTQAQKELFLRAIDAYKNFDLDTLRQIAAMLDDDMPEQADDPEQTLLREIERLLELVRNVRLDLYRIKSQYPYTKKELLEDPVRLAEEKKKLREQLKNAKKQSDIYRKRIEELERMYG